MTSKQFVRASKYRHVHGEPARKDKCYLNAKSLAQGDGDYIHGNSKWIAFAINGGGGPLVVHPRKTIGRLAATPDCINVHQSKLLDFGFSPFNDNLLATCGEDALIKITVVPDGFGEGKGLISQAAMELRGHQKKVSLLAFHPVADNILASVAFDHTCKIWDISTGSNSSSFDHPDQIQSVAWDSNGSQVATTCKDKIIRVFDPRNQSTAQQTQGFEGTKASKLTWITRHGYLSNLGFAANGMRQCALFDPRKFGAPLSVTDIDQSAGALSAHYDEDTSVLFVGGKGDGNIRYFEVTDEAPHVFYLSEFRSAEPHKGFTFLPKRICDVTTCEIDICLRLMKDYIEPISFQVPRKSDVFQEDLFPDTYAGVPGLSSAEWLAGENKEAPRVSMKPGAQPAAQQQVSVFKAVKSSAEYEAELAAAHKKIAELEAEVAKLKK